MKQRSEGYVEGIDYTHGYYRELGPRHAAMALAHAGWRLPMIEAACEPGYGQGLSTNIHAAAGNIAWFGTDFNPAQASFAATLAQHAGSGACLRDDSFADYCARTDLPDFDFIALHGVWSWVSDANRALLREFIDRKLKPGGVLYLSYNCHPGWAPLAPLRELLAGYVNTMTAPGTAMAGRIDAALDFARQLVASQPAYVAAYPLIAERVQALQGQDRRYLAHEYFNRDWQPCDFATVSATLEGVGMGYACAAHHLDQVDLLNLDAGQRALLASLPAGVQCQGVRDLMLNQNFRRDYWIKATPASRLTPAEHEDAMRRQRVVLVMPRADVDLKVRTGTLEVTLNEQVHGPLLDLLADHQPRTVAELEASLPPLRGGVRQLFEAVFILCGNGTLAPAQSPAAIAAAGPACRRLNAALLARARSSDEVCYLASPVVGGGLPMPRIPQLFLLAHSLGHHGAAAWSRYAASALAEQGERLSKDGRQLTSDDEQHAELQRKASLFEQRYFSMYRALGVAD